MNRRVRVLLCDDHDGYRDCIRLSLHAETSIEIVGEAADGLQAVARTLDINPDVVLMDLEMPRLDGIEATRRIKQAAKHIKVLFLCLYDDEEIAGRCLAAGASGYVLKGITCSQLTDAILAVDSGGPAIDPLSGGT
jgi:two-component system, NarL family, response regulator DegU